MNLVSQRLLGAYPNDDIVGGFVNAISQKFENRKSLTRNELKDLIDDYARKQAHGDAELEKRIKEMLDDCY